MTFTALVAVLGLIALLFFLAAARNLRRRRLGLSFWESVAGGLLLLTAAGSLVLAASLRSYNRLGGEQSAGELSFIRAGYHQFNGTFVYPNGETADFELRGDEWQVDARVLKWHALASVLGFDAAYRLDRISGRYTSLEDERTLPRTVYSLAPAEHVDPWQFIRDNQWWLPWVDALYGSATFLPMADGAHYAIKVSPTGLLARPLNDAARTAVGDWH